jgi:hypothetical protein
LSKLMRRSSEMEQEQNTNQAEDEVRAYDILLQRHINDDRLVGERSTAFLAGSSILFLGFVVLLQSIPISWILYVIPALGIILSVLAVLSNWRTSRALNFWDDKRKEIEQKGDSFDYMRQREMEPHRAYEKQTRLTKLRNRHIYAFAFPAVFIILWVSSLVWVIYI